MAEYKEELILTLNEVATLRKALRAYKDHSETQQDDYNRRRLPNIASTWHDNAINCRSILMQLDLT